MTTPTTSPRGLPYAFGTMAMCPNPGCRSADLLTYKTIASSNEVYSAYAYCKVCLTKCIVVLEPSND